MPRAKKPTTSPSLAPAQTVKPAVRESRLPTVFAVIPVMNELGAIADVLTELDAVLEPISSRRQILVIDDGSSDGTPELLRKLARQMPAVSVVELSRRTGKSTAMQAGLDRIPEWARIVVQMDGDGQDDPHDIPAMMRSIERGEADMVTGWRQSRAENVVRTVPSKVANKMIATATGVRVHDFGSPLKVMRADLARTLQLRGDMHRFIPALGALAGARVIEHPVVQRKRETGRSKYGLGRTGKVFLDIIGLYFIQKFADRPIRLFGQIGLWMLVIGIVILGYLGFDKVLNHVSITDRPFFLISIFFLLAGVIIIMNGLVAELLSQSVFRRGPTAPSYIAKDSWFEGDDAENENDSHSVG